MADAIIGKLVRVNGTDRLEFQDHLKRTYQVAAKKNLSFVLKIINFLCECFKKPRWIKLQYQPSENLFQDLYVNVNSVAKRTFLLKEEFKKEPSKALANMHSFCSPEQYNDILKGVRALLAKGAEVRENDLVETQLFFLKNKTHYVEEAEASPRGFIKISSSKVPLRSSFYVDKEGICYTNIKKKINEGSFKIAKWGLVTLPDMEVKPAVKLVSHYNKSSQAKQIVKTEISTLNLLNGDLTASEFVPTLYAHFSRCDKMLMFVEACDSNDLASCIKKNLISPENQKLIFKDMLSILSLLKKHKLVHVDIKPHNLLTYRDDLGRIRLKITDLGLVQNKDSSWDGSGTKSYMSPEMLKARKERATLSASFSMDMFSAGFSLLKMYMGYDFPPMPPENSKDPYLDLIAEMMHPDPKKRITIEGAINKFNAIETT